MTKTATSFSPKFFRTRLKQGDTTQDFMSKFGLTEEELKESISQTFPESFSVEVFRQLSKNDKAAKKQHTSTVSSTPAETSEEITEEATVVETVETATVVPDLPEKDVLKGKLKKAISKKAELEEQIKQLSSENAAERNSLKSINDEVKTLKVRISKLEKAVDSHVSKIAKNQQKLKDLGGTLSSICKDIDSYTARIEELEKIYILAYESGAIENENGEICIIPSDWNNLYQQMISGYYDHNEVLETLTLGQIKQIAKLIALVKTFSTKYDIEFDNKNMEKAWEILKP